jgi:hypothetical protein
MPQQGSLELLNDPVASALVKSVNPARLAYTWMDGSPRVVPIWFHWSGDQFVLGTPPKAPKLKTLAADPRVALTIDDTAWPPGVLLVRGRAGIELLDDKGRLWHADRAATGPWGCLPGVTDAGRVCVYLVEGLFPGRAAPSRGAGGFAMG